MENNRFMLCEEIKKDDLIKNLDRFKNWVFQFKFDGLRGMIYIDNNKIKQIITRQELNCLNQYPEFKEITFKIKRGIIDSEICVFDEEGRSDFNLLSFRSHLKDDEKIADRRNIKPVIMAFDILRFEDEDLTMKPLIKRQEYLNKAFSENDFIRVVGSSKNFEELWVDVIKRRLEGLIMKNLNSAYECKRSKYAVKIKNWKEEIVEFDSYENAVSKKYGFLKGITLTNQDGIRCAVLGEKHKEIKELLDRGQSVKICCQYLEKTSEGKFRFISFKEMIK